MTATTKSQMNLHQKCIESAGFDVRMLRDGTLEVKDPYHLNGKANAGHDLVILRNSRAATKFITDRS